MTHIERLRDESGFIHRRIIGGISGAITGLIRGGNPLAALAGGIRGFAGGEQTVPQATGCPPGFIQTPQGCAPRGTITVERRGGPALGGLREFIARRSTQGGFPGNGQPIPGAPVPTVGGVLALGAVPSGGNGMRPDRPDIPTLAVTGQFGAGFEASIVSRELRLCPPKTVLGVDGVCYNRRDLRNDERAWPRGRRPLMTGGDVRAISIANRAATRLQKKQKQLEDMGMLKKKVCPKPKQLLPGHVAQLAHGSEH